MGGRRSPPRGHHRAIRRRGGHHIPSRNQASSNTAVAAGLALRYDGGSCFRSEHYQTEIDHLGITRSPAFHYEPETNGCAEKAIQTLRSRCCGSSALTLEELRAAVRAFARRSNKHWLIERHRFRTPVEAREHLIRQAAVT